MFNSSLKLTVIILFHRLIWKSTHEYSFPEAKRDNEYCIVNTRLQIDSDWALILWITSMIFAIYPKKISSPLTLQCKVNANLSRRRYQIWIFVAQTENIPFKGFFKLTCWLYTNLFPSFDVNITQHFLAISISSF